MKKTLTLLCTVLFSTGGMYGQVGQFNHAPLHNWPPKVSQETLETGNVARPSLKRTAQQKQRSKTTRRVNTAALKKKKQSVTQQPVVKRQTKTKQRRVRRTNRRR